mmetsp:Transcript_14294/g.33842  ORF Transcript_14294/g.33842 Transcript_14294/m.33842 type:complete len:150 (-) Transcript_14294:996-1445(-)
MACPCSTPGSFSGAPPEGSCCEELAPAAAVGGGTDGRDSGGASKERRPPSVALALPSAVNLGRIGGSRGVSPSVYLRLRSGSDEVFDVVVPENDGLGLALRFVLAGCTMSRVAHILSALDPDKMAGASPGRHRKDLGAAAEAMRGLRPL